MNMNKCTPYRVICNGWWVDKIGRKSGEGRAVTIVLSSTYDCAGVDEEVRKGRAREHKCVEEKG